MGKSKSVRTTISVPASLKRQMDRIKEDVNWSALACRAFREKLTEITSKEEIMTMNAVVRRLKASGTTRVSLFGEGTKSGRNWAMQSAEVSQLESLERLNLAHGDWGRIFEVDSSAVYGPAENLAFGIQGQENHDRGEFQDFWISAVGDFKDPRLMDGEFVRGFATGALDVWRSVKDQV